MRNLFASVALLLLPALTLASSAQMSSPVSQSEQFTVTNKVEVPGKTLKPGTYTISVVDHLSDRLVMRVTNKHEDTEATFLGLYTQALANETTAGPIAWSNTQGDHALRGFTFPGARSVEFVYPKAEAVEIAKNNSDKVLAIDPGSDNLGQRSDNLSRNALQVISLWMLTSTRVGPDNQPAISATRYVPPTRAEQRPTETASTASEVVPPARPAAPVQIASNTRKPLIAALPHTANNIVAPLSLSILAFMAAGLLWFRRQNVERALSRNASRS
jgi:hypothetical protein